MVDALAYFIHTLFSNIRIVFLIRRSYIYTKLNACLDSMEQNNGLQERRRIRNQRYDGF